MTVPTVRPDQRHHSRSRPCPICGGGADLPSGHGQRCYGFAGDDRAYTVCTRIESPHAAGDSNGYTHYMAGHCDCGVTHRGAPAQLRAPSVGHVTSPRIVATYPYTDEQGAPLFEVVRYEPKDFKQRVPDGRGGYAYSLEGVRRVLFGLPEVLAALEAASTVYVVEGEKDALTLRERGLVATCNPMGAGKWRPEYTETLRGARVVIVRDRDEPGEKHARTVAAELRAADCEVRVVEALTGKDASDHLAAGRRIDDFVEVSGETAAAVAAASAVVTPLEHVGNHRPTLVRLSDVEPESVDWLWPGRIALGKITLLDGDPGQLKSTLALDLAARVTTNRPMPDDACGIDGGIVLLTFEDALADTVRPRLDAARADVSRVVAVRGVGAGDDEHLPAIPEDLDAIREAIDTVGAALVIIDPLMAALSAGVNSYRDQDVRRALAPLARLAEETGVAVLVVRHLNKGQGVKALYRGGGSIGIGGAARAVLLAADDPDTEGQHVLAAVKINLAVEPPSLSYRPVEVDGTVAVEWLGVSGHRADALLALPASVEERTACDEAADFLHDLLADGPVPAADAEKAARVAGITPPTLRRAKTAVGVRSQKLGMSAGAVVRDLQRDGCRPANVQPVWRPRLHLRYGAGLVLRTVLGRVRRCTQRPLVVGTAGASGAERCSVTALPAASISRASRRSTATARATWRRGGASPLRGLVSRTERLGDRAWSESSSPKVRHGPRGPAPHLPPRLHSHRQRRAAR